MKKSDIKKMLRASAVNAADTWFRRHGPAGYRLPRDYNEREMIKGDGPLSYVVAVFARSLEANEYRFGSHPKFDDYAKGVIASPLAPWFVKGDPQLRTDYPPTPLPGLGSGLIWTAV